MSLKILCAGCSSEERAAVEAGVRAGLGERTRRDPWTVSLVKFGTGWSVTVDGPTIKGRRTSFMVPGPAGPQAVADAVRSAADPSAPAAAAAPSGGWAAPVDPEGRRARDRGRDVIELMRLALRGRSLAVVGVGYQRPSP